jgi:hypothetical protein
MFWGDLKFLFYGLHQRFEHIWLVDLIITKRYFIIDLDVNFAPQQVESLQLGQFKIVLA